MITAGIDLGSLHTKVAVLRGQSLVGWATEPAGDGDAAAAEPVLRRALAPLGEPPAGMSIGATGVGKDEARFATHAVAEVLAAARGVRFFHPSAPGVIDMGGESTRVARLDDRGDVLEFAVNDKCASGTGIFLDAMAKLMRVSLEEMGPLSLTSTANVPITSTCVVFAESEVVSAIHRQTPRQDILRGIHQSIATRVAGLVGRVSLQGETVVIGGLARNVGIVACLEEHLGHRVTVPERPELVSAVGAALVAAERGGAA